MCAYSDNVGCDAVSEPRPLFVTLKYLEGAIDDLGGCIKELSTRLEPILTPVPPEPNEKSGETLTKTTSSLDQSFMICKDRLMHCTNSISLLLKRLEI
jgi:hypothetical protein